MCGIVYVEKSVGRARKKVLRQYNAQKKRGEDGFGFISIESGRIKGVERSQTERDIIEKLSDETAGTILFHHRYPTSTPNIVESTHPLFIHEKAFKYDYYIAHNGVIQNAGAMKEKHTERGYTYRTTCTTFFKSGKTTYRTLEEDKFNDSEAFALDLAEYLEGKKNTIEACGTIAFIAIRVHKANKKILALFYGRNAGNPLRLLNVVNGAESVTMLSSEGAGELVPENTLFERNAGGNTISATPLVFPRYQYPERGYGYSTWDDGRRMGYAAYSKGAGFDDDIQPPLLSTGGSVGDAVDREYDSLQAQLEENEELLSVALEGKMYPEAAAIRQELKYLNERMRAIEAIEDSEYRKAIW